MKNKLLSLGILGLLFIPIVFAAAGAFEDDIGTAPGLAPRIMRAESYHVSEPIVVEGTIQGTGLPVLVYIDPAESPEPGSGNIPLP